MKQQLGAAFLTLAAVLLLRPAAALAADTAADAPEPFEMSWIDPRDPSTGIGGDPENAGQADVVDASELNYFELPVIDPRYPPIATYDNSEDDPNAVQPADHRALNCIDRLKLPQFARDFYDTLAAESKPAGSSGLGRDGALIDPGRSPDAPLYLSTGRAYVLRIPYPSEPALRSAGFNFVDQRKFVENCVLAAYYAFDQDHPEVFWLREFASYNDTVEHIYYFILKTPDWDIRMPVYQDPSRIKEDASALNESVNSILDTTARMSNYDKITYFNQWLTANNQYNYNVAYTGLPPVGGVAHKAICALTTKDGRPDGGRTGVDGPICEGYSRAFQLLCQRAGIPCVLVSGAGHMWNYVQADPPDTRFYAVDVTWNDMVMGGRPTLDEYLAWGGRESTAYTLVGADTVVSSGDTETFSEQHPEENIVGGYHFVHAIFKMGPALNRLAYVDSVTVTGLEAPAAGARPAAGAALTAEPRDAHHPSADGTAEIFTNPAVTWSPALKNGRFAADTVYTATITYTPLRQGYGLTDADASKITAAGAESITVDASGAIQVVFPNTSGKGGVPAAEDFVCSLPASFVYDGSSKTADVRRSVSSAIHNGYFSLTFSDERGNPVAAPVKPGTYRVLAQVSAHGGYSAGEVSLGTVAIREASGRHGTVSISIGDASSREHSGTAYVIDNEVITVYLTPDPGYQPGTVQVIRADNGQRVALSGGGAVYRFRMPASDVSIQAIFIIG